MANLSRPVLVVAINQCRASGMECNWGGFLCANKLSLREYPHIEDDARPSAHSLKH